VADMSSLKAEVAARAAKVYVYVYRVEADEAIEGGCGCPSEAASYIAWICCPRVSSITKRYKIKLVLSQGSEDMPE